MLTSFAIKNNNFTLAQPSVIPVKMIGGTPLSPYTPVATLISGNPGNTGSIAVDAAQQNIYWLEGHGGVYQYSFASKATALIYNPTTNTAFSNPVTNGFEISPDGTALYISIMPSGGNALVIVKVLTAAPYTATIVAGTTTSTASADGVGTAATFKNIYFICLNQARNGLYIVDNGVPRQMLFATTAVTTLGTQAYGAGYNNAPKISASGNVYSGNYGQLFRGNIVTQSNAQIATVPGYSSGAWYWVPDLRYPTERCAYGASSVDNILWRYDGNLNTFTPLITLAANPQTNAKTCIVSLQNALYVFTANGVYSVV